MTRFLLDYCTLRYDYAVFTVVLYFLSSQSMGKQSLCQESIGIVRSQEAVRSGDRTILDKQRAEGHAKTVWIPGRASDETLSVFCISFRIDSEGHRILRSTIVDPMEEEVVNKLIKTVFQAQENGLIGHL